MLYGMWKSKRTELPSVFDLFFRKNPFSGEFTIFCGLEEVLKFINDFHFTDDQIEYVKKSLPSSAEKEFFAWLKNLNCEKMKVYALKEGSVCFPRIPLIRVEGPLGICQILETALLCLINFPSLLATNAARHRIAAGKDKKLVEFGLRRAQGPDGAVSATRYSYIGGFDGTSNMMAGLLFGIEAKGTQAHSWIQSYTGFETLENKEILGPDGKSHNFLDLVFESQKETAKELGFHNTSQSELLSFAAYAIAFPEEFVALVDTYDTLNSGVPNFLSVALALEKVGYKAVGLRLDSGDMARFSKEARKMCVETAEKFKKEYFKKFQIFCSNELNEEVILDLNKRGHEIDVFAVGTNLVTCQKQPALGCVYKLVEINAKPCIKLSNELSKVTIPGRKAAYRLYSSEGHPLVDLLVPISPNADVAEHANDLKIKVGESIFCQEPFEAKKRVVVKAAKVEPLLHLVWDGKICIDMPSIHDIKKYCNEQISTLHKDHIKTEGPKEYKVSVTKELHDKLHEMWMEAVPIREVS